MTTRPDFDHNLSTDCPVPIKAKITAYMRAVEAWAFKGTQHPEDHAAIEMNLKVARYNLEQTIQSALKRAAK